MFPDPEASTDDSVAICSKLECRTWSWFLKGRYWLFVPLCPFEAIDGIMLSFMTILSLFDLFDTSEVWVSESGEVKLTTPFKSKSAALFLVISLSGYNPTLWSWCLESGGFVFNEWCWEERRKTNCSHMTVSLTMWKTCKSRQASAANAI